MTDVFGINIAQGGAVALLAVVVLMVLTGRLVPRRTYDDLREEKNDWKATAQAAGDVIREQQRQLGETLEFGRTAGHVLTSLPQPGRGVTAGGSLDQMPAPPS